MSRPIIRSNGEIESVIAAAAEKAATVASGSDEVSLSNQLRMGSRQYVIVVRRLLLYLQFLPLISTGTTNKMGYLTA